MNSGAYILQRILSSIPLLFIISFFSFSIIRLNLTIKEINISLIIFFVLSVFVFSLLSKVKSWYFLGIVSLVCIIAFSFHLSKYQLLPFDLFLPNKFSAIFNFLFISLLLFLYWLQSFMSKSRFFPGVILFFSLTILFFCIGSNYPINIKTQTIVLKTGDPLADLRFNPAISEKVLKAEEERLGLNEPWHVQYILWLKGLLHGNLGITQQNQSVASIIKKPILNTLLLSFTTLFATWFIAIPLGIWAALNRNKLIDRFLSIFTSIGMSTPTFVLAVIGLLVALYTQIFPIGGLTSINFYEMSLFEKILDVLKHLILPTTILTLISIASLQRQMRANLLDVLRQDYIKTAIAKGLPINKVIYKHALRNAINPLITIFGFEFASLLSGAALTETILAYPGLGALTLEAARKLDVNLTMTTLMLGAVMLISGNLMADLLLKFADPRIKLGET